jgi:hypothetical protein
MASAKHSVAVDLKRPFQNKFDTYAATIRCMIQESRRWPR